MRGGEAGKAVAQMCDHVTIVQLIKALLWLVGLSAAIVGGAICMQPVAPQTGIYLILIGLMVSGVVDAMDGNFDLLRCGIRGVAMFACLAVCLVWLHHQVP